MTLHVGLAGENVDFQGDAFSGDGEEERADNYWPVFLYEISGQS
jgi:hypothetical protein